MGTYSGRLGGARPQKRPVFAARSYKSHRENIGVSKITQMNYKIIAFFLSE